MPITLKIIGGIMAGREFVFGGPDLFLFGRATDCHCAIPADNYLSRHHFLLEVNPPDCQLKDLGSLNGTYVNNIKYGGRESAEPPEFEAAIGRAVGVRLKNGDIIKAGKIEIQVMIETEESPVLCVKCKAVIPEEEKDRWAFPGGAYLCGKCREVSARPVAAVPRSGQINMEELLRALFGAAGSGQDCPRIPGYEVLRRLGRGGFGEVYLVKRERDGKQLALKVMLSRRQDGGGKGRALFQREMENCMKLGHPNLVRFEEQRFENGLFFFTMEYCAGGSLQDLLSRRGGSLAEAEALPYMKQILSGLAFIHGQGYIHRDLKPENILFDENGPTAKIADLGLAKNFWQAGLSGLTATGAYAGTPYYMPREQIINYKLARPVSDVFAIGATFYRMLTGCYVYDFTGRDPIRAVLEGKVIPAREQKKISREIAAIIDRAIAPEWEDRYQDAGEMKQALEGAAGI
ncbi:MAG: protein kinase [Firmicutes bacterium]|nr:protein kinase [Bacillota bacterium]